jgi:hypothetical protein
LNQYLPKIRQSLNDALVKAKNSGQFTPEELEQISRLAKNDVGIFRETVTKPNGKKVKEFVARVDQNVTDTTDPRLIDAAKKARLESRDRLAQDPAFTDPENIKFFAELERSGKTYELEDNAFDLISLYIRAGAQKQHLGSKIDELMPKVKAFFKNDPNGAKRFDEYLARSLRIRP